MTIVTGRRHVPPSPIATGPRRHLAPAVTIGPGGRHPVLPMQHPRPPSPSPEYWACIDQKDTAHPLNQNRVRFYSLGEFNTASGELCGSSTTNTRSGASLSPAGRPVEEPDRSNLNWSLAQPYAFGWRVRSGRHRLLRWSSRNAMVSLDHSKSQSTNARLSFATRQRHP
jgi:hypothetical protein